MKRYLYVASILAAAAIFIVLIAHFSGPKQENNQKLSEHIGQKTVIIISNASTIWGGAVEPDQNSRNYRTKSVSQKLSSDQMRDLQQLILDDRGYEFDRHKRCVFVPNAAFFFEEEDSIIVLVGTQCQQVKFITAEKTFLLDYNPSKKSLGEFMQNIGLTEELL